MGVLGISLAVGGKRASGRWSRGRLISCGGSTAVCGDHVLGLWEDMAQIFYYLENFLSLFILIII